MSGSIYDVGGKVSSIAVKDIRFPTSLQHHGSDAMHGEVDYSVAYVTVKTDSGDGIIGNGIAFSLGRGNDILVKAVEVLSVHVVGRQLSAIFSNFGKFWRSVTQEGQLRWLGPEKGVSHMAAAGIFNALWDLWGKKVGKPVWRLLADMSAEEIVSLVDFSYITDALTKDEALDILRGNKPTQKQRARPAGEWIPCLYNLHCMAGYSDEVLIKKCKTALQEGWTQFKMKVGSDLEDDIRRSKLIRQQIGYHNDLMMDANQKWDVNEAIAWMKKLAEFKPLWIEEPTSPDDVLGHATIAKALAPLNIGVATGEQCQNRVVFKQLLQLRALSFLQIDACRVGSVNENIAILLLAKKFDVPVCPHGGGVGLCELVQHLAMFDYLCVSASKERRVCEYVDHLHEHFVDPVVIRDRFYIPPQVAGFSIEMKKQSLEDFEFPKGPVWQKLIEQGTFRI